MKRDHIVPEDRYRKLRPDGPRARLLLVDPDRNIATMLRHVLTWHGFGEPQVAEEAEEALDVLGAVAQAMDLLLLALGPNGAVDTRILHVLRRIRSPVRVAAYGPLTPDALGNAAPLTGIAAYIDLASFYGLARHAHDLLATPFTVQHILATARVPLTLDPRWAAAIYGAAPGETFDSSRADGTRRTAI